MSTLLSKEIETQAPSARLPKSAVAMPFYEISIFLGAFLLFSVQLILGKYFLPWYGGTPALWTTCMFFFQALLLAGYAYAHAMVKCFNAKAQSVIHVLLLSAGLLWLVVMGVQWHGFLLPGNPWRPEGDHPVWSLIFLLFVAIGFPFFMLSSTGPLLQSWFTRTHPARSPYRLYALSNLASLLALLTYPVAVEPWLSLRLQAAIWSAGFLTYAITCGFCAWKSASAPALSWDAEDRMFQDASGPSATQSLFWIGLAACSCVMFISTTNQICQDVAVVPFLWILPLSIYLLSFVICFDQPKLYSRSIFLPAFTVSIFLACFLLNGWAGTKIILQITAHLFVLFACCMMCHGELERSKPASRYLTSFYLMVSLGGTVGGAFAALVAPKIFPSLWEYQLGLWGSVLFVLLALLRDKSSWLYSSRFGLPVLAILTAVVPGITAIVNHKGSSSSLWPAVLVLIAAYAITKWGEREPTRARAHAVPLYCITALSVVGALLFFSARGQILDSRMVSRNFYGVLTVRELNSQYSDWRAFTLLHGATAHGLQFRAEDKRTLPTGYYGTTSGAGRTIIALQKRRSLLHDRESLRVGVVGLGVGTLAAYGRRGDYFRFYEINPEVIRLARNETFFTYLKDCHAKLEVIAGDARISMESELQQNQPQLFDVLVIDAFTGDAIPVHLLTKEAFEIYLHESRPEGVIALHITNAHLDLRPLLLTTAEHFQLNYAFLHSQGDGVTTTYNDWVLVSRDQGALDLIATPAEQNTAEQPRSKLRLWTDQYSNLFSVARW